MTRATHCPLTLDDLANVESVEAFAASGVPVLVSKRSRKPGRLIARRTLLHNIAKAQGNPQALESVCAALALQNRAQCSTEVDQVAREASTLPVDSRGLLIVPKAHGRGLKRHTQKPDYPGDNWRAVIDGERMPRPGLQVEAPEPIACDWGSVCD